MDDLDSLFQVVFFVILFVGWILKTIADQRQQRRAPPQRPPPRAGSEAEGHAPGGHEAPLPQPRPGPAPGRPAPGRPAPGPQGREGTVPRSSGGRAPETAATGHGSYGRYQPTVPTSSGALPVSAALVPHQRTGTDAARHRTQRRATLVRLTGGMTGASRHDLVRAGILWREILGPAKALQGPYRTEAARRSGPRRG